MEQAYADKAAALLLDKRVGASAHDVAGETPKVWLIHEIQAGWTGNGADELQAELNAVLASTLMQSKLTKLTKSGHTERHLFLYVRTSGFSFSVYDTLMSGGG